MDWNNIGDSVDTFSQLCHSLMSNRVLNTLILANNNLCQTCGFHLAKMLNINKCLKNIGKYDTFFERTYIYIIILYLSFFGNFRFKLELYRWNRSRIINEIFKKQWDSFRTKYSRKFCVYRYIYYDRYDENKSYSSVIIIIPTYINILNNLLKFLLLFLVCC